MSLPVLTAPFWSRPYSLPKKRRRGKQQAQHQFSPESRQTATGIGLDGGISMYAVIRAGGKQYRVAPGDVVRFENQGSGTGGKIEFTEVLAVYAEPGQIGRPHATALVTWEIVEQG